MPRPVRLHLFTALIPALVFLMAPAAPAADSRPNVILFIADDISWDDLGCTGNPTARTPHLDRLAAGASIRQVVEID